jgi:MFS family permease
MQKTKRMIIATLAGVLFGFVCFGLASTASLPIAWPAAVQIILSRTLIGLAIGISFAYLWHWATHGLAMGLVFSLPLAFSGLMAPEYPEFSKTTLFIGTIALGMIYGLLIELITSVFFRAKIQRSVSAEQAVVKESQ